METAKTYDNYPLKTVLIANINSLSIYAIGAYILLGFNLIAAGLYLLFCLWNEINLLRKACVDCYYYGRICFSGKGKLAAQFFKKGDPQRFANKKFTWKALIPDLLVTAIPLVGAIILSVINFNWYRLGWLVILVVLAFPVTGMIRDTLACEFCKQRELGCPAAEAFGQKT